MKKIILASASPRRRELMKLLGVPFDVVVSDFDESLVTLKDPREFAEELSRKKAEIVAQKFENAVIIGADTVVALGSQILGKPKDEKDAERLLNLLSGTEHSIITGYTVMDVSSGSIATRSVVSKVKLKELTRGEVKAYIVTGEPMDKAGAYAVQEKGGLFVERIDGDFFNIVGLPLKNIREELKKLGIKTLE